MATVKTFSTDISFCNGCGALLPPLPAAGDVTCLACRRTVPADAFADTETAYTVVFNRRDEDAERKRRREAKRAAAAAREGNEDGDVDGPTVERRCSRCGHEKMSYAALQLRSADEGQTVFFTCLKCKFKETENS